MKEQKEQYEADYEEALTFGEVLAAYARVMLIGPAGVGKSSLLHGLMNLVLPPAESTKLAEAMMVKYEWAKAGDPDDSYWSKLEEEDELMEVAKLVRTVVERKSQRKKALLASLMEAFAVKEFSPSTDVPVVTSTEQKPDDKFRQKATEVQKSLESKILSKAQQASAAAASPQKEAMIHVWDCGGQPVFLDVLPAFVTGRTMFFLLFDAKKGLESLYESVYYRNGEVVPGSRKTQNINVLNLLLRWMASIHAMLCKASSNTTDSECPKYPRIIPIGTHGDDPEVKRTTKEILHTLNTHCVGNAFAPLLLDSRIVDNTTAGRGKKEDKEYKYLRKQVYNFAMENVAVRTPVAWFYFQKVFQKVAKENPIVPMEHAHEVANVCNIPKATVPSVLTFFHELAVLFYFSSVKSLRQHIIADPRWLVQQFAKLLALEGQESVPMQHYWQLLREKGVLVKPLYEEVWKGLPIPPQALVDLLEHFLLAARITQRAQSKSDTESQLPQREYFIPSMLGCKPKNEAHQPVESVKQASPLHLTFSTKYVPPGFFARLITTLVKEHTCQLVFERGVFSNQITFAYGALEKIDEITVMEHISSIQINVIRITPRSDRFSIPMFHASCQSILKLLLSCSMKVCEWFPSIKIDTALQCHCKAKQHEDQHYVVIPEGANTLTNMRCERHGLHSATYSQQNWLEIPSANEGASSISEPEQQGVSKEVNLLGKVRDFAKALEMTSDSVPETVQNDPAKLMKQWCPSMDTQARSHLVHHLKGIGLKETAHRLDNNEFKSRTPPSPGPPPTPGTWQKWLIGTLLLCLALMAIFGCLSYFGTNGVRPYRNNPPYTGDCHPIMTTRDLTKALAIIGNWEILCENLGVKKATIENLKMSREPIETQKFRCLEAYRSQKGGCWEEIIKVVADDPFYKEQLAMKIAKQHGIDYSSLSHGIEDEL